MEKPYLCCVVFLYAALSVTAVAGSAVERPVTDLVVQASAPSTDGHINFSSRWAVVLAHDDKQGSDPMVVAFSDRFVKSVCDPLDTLAVPFENRILLIRDDAELPKLDKARACFKHWIHNARIVTLMDVMLGSATSEGQPLAASVPATATDIYLFIGAHGDPPNAWAAAPTADGINILFTAVGEGGLALQAASAPPHPALGDGQFPAVFPSEMHRLNGKMLVWLVKQLHARAPSPFVYVIVDSCYSSAVFNLLVQRVDKETSRTRMKAATFAPRLELRGALFLSSASDIQPGQSGTFIPALDQALAKGQTWANVVQQVKDNSKGQRLRKLQGNVAVPLSKEEQEKHKARLEDERKQAKEDHGKNAWWVSSSTMFRPFRMRAFGDKSMLQHVIPTSDWVPVQIAAAGGAEFSATWDGSKRPVQMSQPPRGSLVGAAIRTFLDSLQESLRKSLVWPGEEWAGLCFTCRGEGLVDVDKEPPSTCTMYRYVARIRQPQPAAPATP